MFARMRGYLQILQRYRTYAYTTEGSAQDWIRRIDNKQSRMRKGAISYLPRIEFPSYRRISFFRTQGVSTSARGEEKERKKKRTIKDCNGR